MAADAPAEILALEWRPPWEPAGATLAGQLAAELAREVGPGHPLFGRPAVAVGRRVDQDDVLFWLPQGPALLAMVHLTWSGQRERRPQWPAVELYDAVAVWADEATRADQ